MASNLSGGFASPSIQSASAFRAIMSAMSQPGMIVKVEGLSPPAPLSPAAAAVCLTLCDHDTTLALSDEYNSEEIRKWLLFHTGTRFADESQADFIVCDELSLKPLETYKQGTDEYPDRSALIIISKSELHNKTGCTLSGPGIENSCILSVSDPTPYRSGLKMFPLGLDFILTSGSNLACLPRTTAMAVG